MSRLPGIRRRLPFPVKQMSVERAKAILLKLPDSLLQRRTSGKIRTVMRFSGPRMLFAHPIMAIRHVCSTLHEKRKMQKRRASWKKKKPQNDSRKLSKSRIVRWLFLIVGFISLGLGTAHRFAYPSYGSFLSFSSDMFCPRQQEIRGLVLKFQTISSPCR